jgi:hypothetical protein
VRGTRGRPPPRGLSAGSLREPPRRISCPGRRSARAGRTAAGQAPSEGAGAGDAPWGGRGAPARSAPLRHRPGGHQVPGRSANLRQGSLCPIRCPAQQYAERWGAERAQGQAQRPQGPAQVELGPTPNPFLRRHPTVYPPPACWHRSRGSLGGRCLRSTGLTLPGTGRHPAGPAVFLPSGASPTFGRTVTSGAWQ